MNKFLLSFALMCGAATTFAQTTVTSNWFARVGDVIYGATDSTTAVLTTPAGMAAQTWDFASLQATTRDTFQLFPASSGSAAAVFPTATFRTPFMGGDGYGRTTATKTEILGFSGDPGIGASLDIKFSDPIEFQTAPINYGSVINNTSAFKVTLATADYPQISSLITANLPAGATADSMRLNRTSNVRDDVDAHGTVNLPVGTYTCLRLNRTEITNTKVELRIKLSSFLPATWIDLSTLGTAIPGTGKDTLYSHIFVSNNEHRPVVTVNLAKVTFAPTSVNYIFAPTATENIAQATVEMSAMPNPATTEARITIGELPKGNYSLRLQNVLGQIVVSQPTVGNETLRLDVSRFEAGMYMYSVCDEKGAVLATKRLQISK